MFLVVGEMKLLQMDTYQKWLLRSRSILFVGAGLLIGPTLDGFRFDFTSKWKVASHLIGLVVMLFGYLDCMGLICRRKVKEAIREHNAARRRG